MCEDEDGDLQLALVLMRLMQCNPKYKDVRVKEAADKLDKHLREAAESNGDKM